MKSFLFIILATYAVKSNCDEYYLVDVLDEPPIKLQTKKPFKVYWNVPTMQCSSKKIYFNNLFEDFGIIQNDNDRFKGDKVTMLYDPGLFPALLINETTGNFSLRNGGVPQEGDLDKHLDEFRTELDRSIPNKNFNGVGIVDFESWRPIFRQNFGTLQPHHDFSIEIEKKLHLSWNNNLIQDEAKRRFEEAARLYMQSTLLMAKQLRPLALWGFYGFPYCFNMPSNHNMAESCANNFSDENDQTNWLWSDSTALFPSVYSSSALSTSQLVSLIRGRVKEAARCAKTVGENKDILPYIWFRYKDGELMDEWMDGFLSKTDLTQALSTLYKSEATGMMIWGSSNDVNTVAKCNKLLTYVQTVLGPAIAKYTKLPNKLNDLDNDTVSVTATSEDHRTETENESFMHLVSSTKGIIVDVNSTDSETTSEAVTETSLLKEISHTSPEDLESIDITSEGSLSSADTTDTDKLVYNVTENPDDPTIYLQTKKTFKVYWNVPTMQCSSKKIYFDNLFEDFGIIQNDNDRFKGDKVTMLYDPGLFPALLINETTGNFSLRNGGVPQEGDLDKHLDEFRTELDRSIPNKNYSGIGIIDFESWQPIFRHNFGTKQPHKEFSIEVEKKLHSSWNMSSIQTEAKRRFEDTASLFMQTTLSMAKKLRPFAQWGFYGFPYCFNMASDTMAESCTNNVSNENDQISWLWSDSAALFPSVYSSSTFTTSQLVSLIKGRVKEAARCAKTVGKNQDIFPYIWFRYRNGGFLSQTDLTQALSTLYKSEATGMMIWGSSGDVNTVDKCNKLLTYVQTVFGPAVAIYTKPPNRLNDYDNDTVSVTATSKDHRTETAVTNTSLLNGINHTSSREGFESLDTSSDEISRYNVTGNPDDPTIHLQTKKPFKVYWNVPTMQCSSKKIYFNNLFEDFGIIQNDNDRFKGDKVTMLYDPGLFPALLINETTGNFSLRNGGVPQEGDLDKHLDEFRTELDRSIPNKNYSGIGIIDFESWQPIFRHNFGTKQPHKEFSIGVEKKLHSSWNMSSIHTEAKRRFEDTASLFMQTTLSMAKKLRPFAQWGFYGFPYCFNMASDTMAESCTNNVSNENDQISWLWSDSAALFPSVYSSSTFTTSQLVSLIKGRVKEAARCAKTVGKNQDIFPYIWFRYRNGGFLSQTDLTQALSTLYKSEATGMMIWGSSGDVNTVDKCNKLLTYVQTIFGPAVAIYTKPPNRLNDYDNDTVSVTATSKDHRTETAVTNTSLLNGINHTSSREGLESLDTSSDEISRYNVTENPDDPTIYLQTKKTFKVYWNVPTMQCSSKKIYFNNLFEDFGIIQNDNDRFKGDKVTMLYDPGLFPALLINETTGNFSLRNGGVPQEGDLDKHLDEFRTELDRSIPNKNYSGIGIIDFESWQPIFRHNFGTKQPHKEFSIEVEKKLHSSWNMSSIQTEAKRRFEDTASLFMQTTLSMAKKLRPFAQWGFYGFPYCFNMASDTMAESCTNNVSNENDQISWLWSDSAALFPSVYSSSTFTTSQLVSLIKGRVKEAARCAKTVGKNQDIFPYIWFRYRNGGFLSQTDLTQALSTLYKSEATGMMIWGSSGDVNTVDKCNKLLTYVQTVFGPAVAIYTKPPNRLNDYDNDTVSVTATSKDHRTETAVTNTSLLNGINDTSSREGLESLDTSSDEISRYNVTENPDDPTIYLQTKKTFKVYWNVPTMQCSSKKIYFNNLFEDFGIIQNDNDRFKGDKVTMLYDPGLFPALLINETTGNFSLRNGGVPQEGDLDKHLDEFRTELDRSIPNKNYSGIAIIDFESWRPIFRQNFGTLQPHYDFSFVIERTLHKSWDNSLIQDEAKIRFEKTARLFMQSTLLEAKKLRPLAVWGFYGFPYCFNMPSDDKTESCANNVSNENDQINWLWSDSTALFPSVYSSSALSTSQLVSLIRGRVKEAARCAKTVGEKKDILPYIWFRYRDGEWMDEWMNGFLSQTDLTQALSTLYKSEATGMMIWGSSNDVNTVDKCNKLLTYVQTVLGPAIAKYTKLANKLNDLDNDTVRITATSNASHVFDYVSNATRDPGFDMNLAENYTNDLKSPIQKEVIGNIHQNITKDTASQNNSILTDLILNKGLDNLVTIITTDSPSSHTDTQTELFLDLVSSTAEFNAKVASTDTSATTSKVVTDNSSLNEINHTSSRDGLESVDITSDGSSGSADTTTIEKSMDPIIDVTQSTQEESGLDSVTTTEGNVYTTVYKNDDDSLGKLNKVSVHYFDTLDKETSTISTDVISTQFATNLRKSEKKIVRTNNFIHYENDTTPNPVYNLYVAENDTDDIKILKQKEIIGNLKQNVTKDTAAQAKKSFSAVMKTDQTTSKAVTDTSLLNEINHTSPRETLKSLDIPTDGSLSPADTTSTEKCMDPTTDITQITHRESRVDSVTTTGENVHTSTDKNYDDSLETLNEESVHFFDTLDQESSTISTDHTSDVFFSKFNTNLSKNETKINEDEIIDTTIKYDPNNDYKTTTTQSDILVTKQKFKSIVNEHFNGVTTEKARTNELSPESTALTPISKLLFTHNITDETVPSTLRSTDDIENGSGVNEITTDYISNSNSTTSTTISNISNDTDLINSQESETPNITNTKETFSITDGMTESVTSKIREDSEVLRTSTEYLETSQSPENLKEIINTSLSAGTDTSNTITSEEAPTIVEATSTIQVLSAF